MLRDRTSAARFAMNSSCRFRSNDFLTREWWRECGEQTNYSFTKDFVCKHQLALLGWMPVFESAYNSSHTLLHRTTHSSPPRLLKSPCGVRRENSCVSSSRLCPHSTAAVGTRLLTSLSSAKGSAHCSLARVRLPAALQQQRWSFWLTGWPLVFLVLGAWWVAHHNPHLGAEWSPTPRSLSSTLPSERRGVAHHDAAWRPTQGENWSVVVVLVWLLALSVWCLSLSLRGVSCRVRVCVCVSFSSLVAFLITFV